MAEAQQPRLELIRGLGVSHATAVVVGTIIGSGIFLVPREMMQAVGTAKMVYLAWIVGGVLSFFGALTYAELGAMKPESGGEYAYIRDAFGPMCSFLYAWTWFIIAKPASIGTVTMGVVRVLSRFEALAFLQHEAFHSASASVGGNCSPFLWPSPCPRSTISAFARPEPSSCSLPCSKF